MDTEVSLHLIVFELEVDKIKQGLISGDV